MMAQHNEAMASGLRVRTAVKAGLMMQQHNETLTRGLRIRTAVKEPPDRVRRINLFGNTGVAVGHSSILMRSRSLVSSK